MKKILTCAASLFLAILICQPVSENEHISETDDGESENEDSEAEYIDNEQLQSAVNSSPLASMFGR